MSCNCKADNTIVNILKYAKMISDKDAIKLEMLLKEMYNKLILKEFGHINIRYEDGKMVLIENNKYVKEVK